MTPPGVTVAQLRRMVDDLPDTCEAPHVDRVAFKAGRGARQRTMLTLAPDQRSINLMLTPDEQALKCTVAPALYVPVPGGWGRMGATTVQLSAITAEELRMVIGQIHSRVVARKSKRPRI